MSIHSSFKQITTKTEKTHHGQKKSSARKRRNRILNMQARGEEAKQKGITVVQLITEKIEETRKLTSGFTISSLSFDMGGYRHRSSW